MSSQAARLLPQSRGTAVRSVELSEGEEHAVTTPGRSTGQVSRADGASDAGPKDPRRVEAEIDHALVRRAQAGEEEAFAGLVERHQRRAFRVARNLVPTDEDAQDLAQEAFLRVFKNVDRFDFGHDFTTWLYRIVTNLCIDFLRKRRAAFSVSQGLDEDDGPMELEDVRQAAPSDHAEALETAAEVDAVLRTLAPHFQSVLTLREIEGLSCPEIAEIVGATHVTVRWRLHRGRKLFQEEWERRARMRQQGACELLESGLPESEASERGTSDASPGSEE